MLNALYLRTNFRSHNALYSRTEGVLIVGLIYFAIDSIFGIVWTTGLSDNIFSVIMKINNNLDSQTDNP